MSTKSKRKASIERMKKNHSLVREYLFSKYQSKGGDFVFNSKKVRRAVPISIGQIRFALNILYRNNEIFRFSNRYWKTNFSKKEIKTVVEVEPSLYERLKKIIQRKSE